MHIQIVNFHLNELSDAEFRGVCDELAPAFADVPGLVSKVWLANAAANTYGGVYTWASREAMEEFSKSELFASVASNPRFESIASADFDVLEGPTRITRGLAEVAV
jgi:heme-degrading monooxygenase HmoA